MQNYIYGQEIVVFKKCALKLDPKFLCEAALHHWFQVPHLTVELRVFLHSEREERRRVEAVAVRARTEWLERSIASSGWSPKGTDVKA